jgi:hypothetical protein
VLVESDSVELQQRLELLDDAVYDAIAGDARALEELSRLWPSLIAEMGPDKLEESREQYLLYALSIWEGCIDNGLSDPERALASLQVLTILFGDR